MTTDSRELFKQALQALPDRFNDEAAEIRRADYQIAFRKGDFAIAIHAWLLKQGMDVPLFFACQLASYKLAGDPGAYRLLDYTAVCLTIKSERARHRYSALPMSHLEWAIQFEPEQRNAILERDLEITATMGRPSLSALKAEFAPEVQQIVNQAISDSQIPMEQVYPPGQDELIQEFSDLPAMEQATEEYLNRVQRLYHANPRIATLAAQIGELLGNLLRVIDEEVHPEMYGR